ncbi:MAG TPA: hypothetical protein VFE06_19245 [Acidobacteriaceae bacterium]|jgi:hypothetical protein|nr:hypothetical protein [Acidobacteriaceae bacterium]
MDTEVTPLKLARQVEHDLSEMHWTRGVAAGSLLVSAILLITGRRKSALAVAAAGAAVALLENPEAVRDFWDQAPRLLRSSQDFLVRIEDFMEELNKQGIRLRKAASGD